MQTVRVDSYVSSVGKTKQNIIGGATWILKITTDIILNMIEEKRNATNRNDQMGISFSVAQATAPPDNHHQATAPI